MVHGVDQKVRDALEILIGPEREVGVLKINPQRSSDDSDRRRRDLIHLITRHLVPDQSHFHIKVSLRAFLREELMKEKGLTEKVMFLLLLVVCGGFDKLIRLIECKTLPVVLGAVSQTEQ